MIVGFTTVSQSGQGFIQVSCPAGMRLLSCGNRNTQYQNGEFSRSTKPLSATTCQCYDRNGVECRAWCSSRLVRDVEISSVTSKMVFKAWCPNGKKVLGCYMSPQLDKSAEIYPAFYPSDDGTSCTCYHYFGAECLAICASSIPNYEINSKSGSGVVVVGCQTPGNQVLGCGSKDNGPESFLTNRVSGSTTCECYNYYGVTCFAICGQLTSKEVFLTRMVLDTRFCCIMLIIL